MIGRDKLLWPLMDEQELIKRIVKKDHLAFKWFVERYQSLVLNTCFNIIRNRKDAEDTAQDVFLQVYKSAANFRQESKITTWLYRIAVNRSLNFKRNNKKFSWLKSLTLFSDETYDKDSDVSIPHSERPDEITEETQTLQICRRIINSLPEKQRAAWTLHKMDGLSYKEIAGIMQRSVPSVEALIHRAKLKLQKELLIYLKEEVS